MGLIRCNKLRDGPRHHEDLEHGPAASTVRGSNEILRHDGVQAMGENALSLCRLSGWKRVNQPVYRLDGAGGMQRTQDQVACSEDGTCLTDFAVDLKCRGGPGITGL